MDLIKTHQFDFEGNRYEVRISSDGENIEIQTFLNDTPANGYLYSVRFATRLGMKNNLGVDAVEDLMQQAESDVKAKMWERYTKALASRKP
jgi:hypothetical protein